jgi:hypothetical protein
MLTPVVLLAVRRDNLRLDRMHQKIETAIAVSLSSGNTDTYNSSCATVDFWHMVCSLPLYQLKLL